MLGSYVTLTAQKLNYNEHQVSESIHVGTPKPHVLKHSCLPPPEPLPHHSGLQAKHVDAKVAQELELAGEARQPELELELAGEAQQAELELAGEVELAVLLGANDPNGQS